MNDRPVSARALPVSFGLRILSARFSRPEAKLKWLVGPVRFDAYVVSYSEYQDGQKFIVTINLLVDIRVRRFVKIVTQCDQNRGRTDQKDVVCCISKSGTLLGGSRRPDNRVQCSHELLVVREFLRSPFRFPFLSPCQIECERTCEDAGYGRYDSGGKRPVH